MTLCHVLGRTLAAELRNGIGYDIEFVSSRPVWVTFGESIKAMPFNGVVILLPLIVITFGSVYEEEYERAEETYED
jgi:hypothetical protein|tara:strand:- start:243 stop:470 length:228 start_codon:yes stop_codon:yes gene_type:complete